MSDESAAGWHTDRPANAAPMPHRRSPRRPVGVYNHRHHQRRDTGVLDADIKNLPFADEHRDKLTLLFILNNSVADRASASDGRPVELASGPVQQQQTHALAIVAESTRQARAQSCNSSVHDRRTSSTYSLRVTNTSTSLPRANSADCGFSSVLVSPMVQQIQMSSPVSDRGSSATGVEQSRLDKKRERMCKIDGCKNYIVHKGLCCRHGGDKKCSIEGCNTSAKHLGLCWRHGGSTECDIDGCTKRAKARRLCWVHGSGTKCGNAECGKVAVLGGFCWAPSGGKRCNFKDCNKPAYERTHNFCAKHHADMQHVNYFEV